MVELPDQDWLAFGFWLTAPMTGERQDGVVYDGMDYGYRCHRYLQALDCDV